MLPRADMAAQEICLVNIERDS
eukprot:COSAG01_NODE_36901_length_511_cov_0.905340_2_plen_21_part_01